MSSIEIGNGNRQFVRHKIGCICLIYKSNSVRYNVNSILVLRKIGIYQMISGDNKQIIYYMVQRREAILFKIAFDSS